MAAWRMSQREEATVKRSLRIVALATVAALVALTTVLLLGTGTGAAAPSSAQAGKWCAGKKIVFFPGGPAGGVFAVNVYNGAVQAQKDLGPSVTYEWSNWNPATMISQFKAAMAMKPTGIDVMGHPGDPAFDKWIDQAEAKGIIVTSQNTTLPLAEAKWASKGFGYVGQDLYHSGYLLGQSAVTQLGLKKGDRAMVWGLLSEPSRGLRTKGAIDALKKAGLTVDYIEINDATNANPTAGTPVFTAYVSSHPDVKLVVTDHGGLTATAQTYLTAAHKKPGQIGIAGFDLSPATVTAIQGGWTELVLDQQEWLQGYLPILQTCLTAVYKFAGLYIDTGSGIINKSNIGPLVPLVKKLIR
jgi:simple sugar transport system substrate-binding protein